MQQCTLVSILFQPFFLRYLGCFASKPLRPPLRPPLSLNEDLLSAQTKYLLLTKGSFRVGFISFLLFPGSSGGNNIVNLILLFLSVSGHRWNCGTQIWRPSFSRPPSRRVCLFVFIRWPWYDPCFFLFPFGIVKIQKCCPPSFPWTHCTLLAKMLKSQ